MKNILIVLFAFGSFSAFAGESYKCNDTKKTDGGFELNFENDKSVTVATYDGDEYSLSFANITAKNIIFGNYEYDGYGGSIELLLPQNFTISESKISEEFKASLTHKIYSELGHVGTEKVSAVCKKAVK